MDDQHEEVEHIPWGELLASTEDGRRRLIYLVAAAIGVLALAVVGTRALSAPPTAGPPTLGVVDTSDAVVTPIDSAPVTIATTTTASTVATTTTLTPILYREADLMAFPPDTAARAAVARAEWFVTDYFTADLEPNGTADVRSALPSGVDLPEMPQDGETGLAYVEWARAFSIEEAGNGHYLVGVVYRLLGAPPESGFMRMPVRAVEVAVGVSETGGSVVLDLPSPIVMPAGPVPDPWPTAVEEPPESVANGAIASAAGWGIEYRVHTAARITGGWRVVLTAADEVGNRWPLVVRVDDSGLLLDVW